MPIRIQRVFADPVVPVAGGPRATSDDFGGQLAATTYQAGQELARTGTAGLDVIQRAQIEERKSKQALEGFTLLMDARLALDGMEREAKEQNDHNTYESTVVSGYQRVTQDTLARTNDQQVKAFLARELAEATLKGTITARKDAREMYVSQGRAQMADRLGVARDMILGTPDPAARARMTGLTEGAVRAQVGRLYTAEEAQKILSTWGRDLQEGQALVEMRIDPEGTEERLLESRSGFEKIAPDTRARLANQARSIADARTRESVRAREEAEKKEAKRIEEERKAAVDELDSRARAGTLNLEELEQARRDRVAVDADYRRLYDLVQGRAAAGGRTDDRAYNALEGRLLAKETSGTRARREIQALERAGRLASSGPRSAATLLKMVKDDEAIEGARPGKDITKDPMFDQGLDDIKTALPASSGPMSNFDDTLLTRRRNAIREYHDKARAKGMTPGALPEEARKIIDRYLKEQPSQFNFGGGTPESQLRYRDPAHLLKDRDAGLVPEAEFNRQAELFRAIAERDKTKPKAPAGGKK